MPGPGELCDKHGVPIYPGDLLRSPHYRDGRGMRHYLYHTAILQDGVMCMVPTTHLEPTKASGGGKCVLFPYLASEAEVIHGYGPGDCLDYTDRPKRKSVR